MVTVWSLYGCLFAQRLKLRSLMEARKVLQVLAVGIGPLYGSRVDMANTNDDHGSVGSLPLGDSKLASRCGE